MLGRIYDHQIAYETYGPFVNICGRNLFNPTQQTYLDLGFEVLPELEPLEGYHTAWRVAPREVIPPEPEPEEDITPAEEQDSEAVEQGEENSPSDITEEDEEPEPQYEEYIEAYYEADPEPEDPEEIARRQEAERRAYWTREFFQTSLGWVRKKPTMKDGSVDNFLTDDLPLIAIAMLNGEVAKVFVYATPDYTQEIDPIALQSYVSVTPLFIKECLDEKQNEFV